MAWKRLVRSAVAKQDFAGRTNHALPSKSNRRLPPNKANSIYAGLRHPRHARRLLPTIVSAGPATVAGLGGLVVLPVFVINLDRRRDRWDAISAHLDRLGIEATRIAAVDGRLIRQQDIWERETNDNVVERVLTPPEEGCLLSHCKAMSAFLGTKARAALILEDDICLAPDLSGVLESVDWWPHHAVRVVKLVTSNQPSRAVLLRRPIGRTPCGRDIQPIVVTAQDGSRGVRDVRVPFRRI